MAAKIQGNKEGISAAAFDLEGVSTVSESPDSNVFDEVALRASN